MIKSKKISKILISLILILVTSFSIVFVAMQINNTTNDTNLNLSAVSDTSVNNLFLIEPYAIIDDIGCYKCNNSPTVGKSMDNPYREAPWNGRIKCINSIPTNNYNRQYSLELNVDVRDIKWPFMDDVIVEFKFYYQEPNLGLKKTHKISSLSIETKFYGEKGITTPKVRSCSDTSSAGFTIQGGTKTNRVEVKVSYSFYNDYNYGSEYLSKEVYFVFSGNEACDHEIK